MNNILVTGADGQLGSELQVLSHEYPNYTFFFTDKDTLDITDKVAIAHFCTKNQINSILNCAAHTAVDKAENEETALCDAINHKAVAHISAISKEQNIKLIHVSTDYVFDGKNHKAFIESDAVNPINVYGKTKSLGEKALIENKPENSIIIRTSWVYSSFGNNFVKTMLKLAQSRDTLNIVADQIGTPTYAHDLAKTMLAILPKINNKEVEIYHYSNEGICSWYDFAFEIFNQTHTSCKVLPIESKDYPTPAPRPLFSLLNKAKIKKDFGIAIPHWKEALSNCLSKL